MHMRTGLVTKRISILVTLLGFWGTAMGVQTEGLYSAQVPLSVQSDSALNGAFDIALGEVLIKVTGRRDIWADGTVRSQFGGASALVQQYRMDPDDEVWVLFDRVAIKRTLDQLGLPVWGDERPTTLVWLIMDAGTGQREILAAGSNIQDIADLSPPARLDSIAALEESVRETLQTAAEARGVPLVLPLVDSEELRSISISAVWGGFAESLEIASERYGADAVLVGRARLLSSEQVQARWTLLADEERMDWDGDVASGPNELADYFAARLATSIGTSRRILLQVNGVDSLDDYGRVNTYLEALDVVEGHAVDRVAGSEVIFSLEVRGDLDRLMRTIALRRVLQLADERFDANPDDDPFISGVERQTLRYQLIAEP